MSKQSDAVKRWRHNTKQKLIYALGGKCCLCEYNKCNDALEFHHIDPSEKDFHWGKINGNIRSWATIISEMKKCVCVCSNCHREVHAGLVTIPSDAQLFDESLIPTELVYDRSSHDDCPVCGKLKLKARRTCSTGCANAVRHRVKKVDWTVHDVVKLVDKHKTYEAVGELLGVTGAAVARKYKQAIKQLSCSSNSRAND